jgi:hypothetical protein
MDKYEEKREEKTVLILLLLITLVGFTLRLYFFIGSKFPLFDGGFFYVMVKDIIANKFYLPEYSTYNHANIPFVYPPLGLYFVGIVESTTGLELLQLFRYIPLLISSLTIPAFFLLALDIIKERWAALAATAIFSILPNGFTWLIQGGGITRAFGALFGILALTFVIRFIESGVWIAGVLACIFCGFTVLSHPEWAWFLFYSIGIFCILKLVTKARRIFFRAFLLFLGSTVIVIPWLLTVIIRHGNAVILPFIDIGFSRWNEIINLFLLNWSGGIFVPISTLLAIVGIFSLLKKEKFLVLWLPLVFFLQGRATGRKAVIPLALLAGIGAKAIIDFVRIRFPEKTNLRMMAMIVGGIYIYTLIGSMIYSSSFDKPLPEQFITGIEWFKQESPIDSKFLMITGNYWNQDNYSEWINALSARESVSVVQGYEWLPGFTDRIARNNQLQYEYSNGISDFVAWINQSNIKVDYLVFPKGNQTEVNYWYYQPALHLNDARLYPGVEVAFENDGVLILDIRALFHN